LSQGSQHQVDRAVPQIEDLQQHADQDYGRDEIRGVADHLHGLFEQTDAELVQTEGKNDGDGETDDEGVDRKAKRIDH